MFLEKPVTLAEDRELSLGIQRMNVRSQQVNALLMEKFVIASRRLCDVALQYGIVLQQPAQSEV